MGLAGPYKAERGLNTIRGSGDGLQVCQESAPVILLTCGKEKTPAEKMRAAVTDITTRGRQREREGSPVCLITFTISTLLNIPIDDTDSHESSLF